MDSKFYLSLVDTDHAFIKHKQDMAPLNVLWECP